MKKMILTSAALILAACTATPPTTQPDVALQPPTKVQGGYIKVAPDADYYIDSNSIWIDNEDTALVHFNAVINLKKGLHVYKSEPNRYARSLRQYKILNCKTYRLTQIRTDFYDNFWGEGVRAAPKKQPKHTVKLQPNSSLYTLGQIICANHRNS